MPALSATPPLAVPIRPGWGKLPGVLLCLAVMLVAFALERIEAMVFGHVWLEALVLAILAGTAVRSAWTPGALWRSGIDFSAKTLLEVAVVLLGLSISTATVRALGGPLLLGIAATVAIAIVGSFGIGRALGLPARLAMLVACGNSICGNSAIAAVAPVIGADSRDVASSIAFTAVLGVVVVLALPLVAPLLGGDGLRYGTLAGLTVYAVPQVLAATAPVGALSVQMGTVVKLVRVLMLGPVVLVLSLAGQRLFGGDGAARRPPLHRLVPWFIIGFLLLATVRSSGTVPEAVLPPVALVANLLTVLAMAALGLGVDVRTVARAGVRVTAYRHGVAAAAGRHQLGADRRRRRHVTPRRNRAAGSAVCRTILTGMMPMRALATLAAFACLLGPFAAAADPTPADGDAIHTVITSQLDAFRRDDADGAFAYAAPAIQGQFGEPGQVPRHGAAGLPPGLPPPLRGLHHR